jgi:hypothetical protein
MNYLSNAKMKYYLLSLFTFILALLSKETAVVLPLLVVIVTIFTSYHNNTDKSINRYIGVTIPYFLILTGYLYQHFFVYGLATGDSYIWDFSLRKLANSTTWYALWSMGLPEMLVDFVGPGMRINPNLFLYWGSQITVILFLFTLLILLLTLKTYQHYIHRTRTHLVRVAVFSGIWFGVCLLPVIFLPLHKFSFYLTLPLFGVVLSIGYLFKDSKVGSPTAIIFLFIWTALQIYTLKLTVNTHWITRGAVVAQAVYKHIETNKTDFAGKQLVFVDTPEDELLPWSPTEVVKVALSDLNFFKHYYGDSIMAMYGGETKVGVVRIISRQFLGY